MERRGSLPPQERGGPFGHLLRRHREAAGWTQEELAERSGLTAKAISAIERGERRRPYPQTVRALADALDLSDSERAGFIAGARPRSGEAGAPAALGGAGTIPEAATRLVGRAAEVELITDQLLEPDVRLLTLVGPGGVGKTRLAIAAATALRAADRFADGVVFVDLSVGSDPSHVVALIARDLQLPATASDDPMPALEAFVARRRMLLVLDNFEQVLDAAQDVSRLLMAGPGIVVLATSVAALRLRWERTLAVSPLALPDPRHLPSPEALAEVPAVALFLDRARASSAAFRLTSDNAAPVAELCVRLDGLPLAIELVAARVVQLGPAATLDRLARRLPIATPGMLDAPARQRSLRATLEWSLELLDEPEQRLFRRLGVFASGWNLDAAEAIGGDLSTDTHGALLSLVDRSLISVLVSSTLEAPRFRMLETARQVALELLAAEGEDDDVRRRHAAHFATVAERAAADLQGPRQAAVAAHLEREEDNVRQALDWILATRDPDAMELGLRITGALGWFWFLHGYPPEARGWFEMLLHASSSDRAGGRPDGEEAPRLDRLRARALNAAGFRATDQGDYQLAAGAHREALVVWRRLDDVDGLVASLHGVGDTALWVGEPGRAGPTYQEGLELARARGTPEQVALFEFHLAQLAWLVGDLASADTHGHEALAVAERAGSTTWPPYACFVLASVAHERGDVSSAGRLYREAIGRAWGHHDRLGVRMTLPGLAGLATLEGDPVRAIRLAGAASALEENAGIWAFPPIRERHERWLAAARAALDEASANAAWEAGRAMSIDEAIADALEPAHPSPARREIDLLSRREREVLALLAAGLTNREIGESLFVTEHTAKYHVTSLFNKIGVSSRAEAVARAIAMGLIEPSRD